MVRKHKHWSDKYKKAQFQSKGYWMRCLYNYRHELTENVAESVASCLMNLPGHKRNMYHALWLTKGAQGPCPCAPCKDERNRALAVQKLLEINLDDFEATIGDS